MQVLQRIVAYGCLGILIEVLFTGLGSLLKKNWSATSTTYLWMLPIYGLGGLIIEATHTWLISWPIYILTIIYTVEIYAVEFCSGWVLRHTVGKCPWDYSDSRFNIMGLVRLDYFPFWYGLAYAAHFLHPYLFKAVNALSRI